MSGLPLLSYVCILWLQTEETGGSAHKEGSTLIPESNNTAWWGAWEARVLHVQGAARCQVRGQYPQCDGFLDFSIIHYSKQNAAFWTLDPFPSWVIKWVGGYCVVCYDRSTWISPMFPLSHDGNIHFLKYCVLFGNTQWWPHRWNLMNCFSANHCFVFQLVLTLLSPSKRGFQTDGHVASLKPFPCSLKQSNKSKTCLIEPLAYMAGAQLSSAQSQKSQATLQFWIF